MAEAGDLGLPGTPWLPSLNLSCVLLSTPPACQLALSESHYWSGPQRGKLRLWS